MSIRVSLFIGALLAAALPARGNCTPAPVAPAARGFRLGALQLYALRDMLNVLPNDGRVFGKDVGATAVAAELRRAGAAPDGITLGVDALLVRLPTGYALIDTGLGPKVGGMLPRSLALAGVRPDDVTLVLVTHSHGDHIGGLLTAGGALAFPNATVRMSAAEWTWLRGMPAMAAMVAAIAPRVSTFAPGDRVAPGITAVALPGHTPGHVGYEIVSRGQRLLDIGDTAHSSILSLAEPGWTIGYDTDATAGRARRETLLATLATSHERVFAPHFPFPGTGTIAKATTGYAWVPDRP